MDLSLKLKILPGLDIAGIKAAVGQMKAEAAAMSAAFKNGGVGVGAKMQSEFKATAEAIKGVQGNSQKMRDEFGRFIPSIKQAKEDAQKLKDEIAKVVPLTKQISDSGSLLSKAFQFNQAKQAIDTLAGSVSSLASPFTALDTSTAKIKTLGGAAKAQADELRTAAIQMSKELPIAANDIQTATYDALSAGVTGTTAQIGEFTKTAAKLAVGGSESIGNTTNLLSSVMNAYGISADKAGSVSDKLFNTVNLGKVSVSEMNASMANIIPTAASLGISLDTVGGAIAVMTSKGTPFAQASTQMNALFGELAKGSQKLTPYLDKLGLTLDDLKGEKAVESMAKLKDAFQKDGVAAIQVFSSGEASKAFDTLTGKAGEFKTAVENVGHTKGSTDDAFAEMQNTVANRTQQMKNDVDAFTLGAIDSMGGFGIGVVTVTEQLGGIAPQLTALGALGSVIPEGSGAKIADFAKSIISTLIPSLFSAVPASAAATGAIGVTTATTAAAGASATATGGLFASMWTTILLPALPVIAALAAVGAAIYLAYQNVKPFRDAVDQAFKFLKDALDAAMPALEDLWAILLQVGGVVKDLLVTYFEAWWAVLKAVFTVIGNVVSSMFGLKSESKSTGGAIESLKKFFDGLQKTLVNVKGTIAGVQGAFHEMKVILGEAFDAISNLDFSKAFDILAKTGERTKKAYDKSWNDAVKVTKDGVAKVDAEAAKGDGATNPAKKPAVKAASDDKKKKEQTDLQIAKELLETQKLILDDKAKQLVIDNETKRLEDGRAGKDKTDDLKDAKIELDNIRKKREETLKFLKVTLDKDGKITSFGLKLSANEKNEVADIIRNVNLEVQTKQNTVTAIELGISGGSIDDQLKDLEKSTKDRFKTINDNLKNNDFTSAAGNIEGFAVSLDLIAKLTETANAEQKEKLQKFQEDLLKDITDIKEKNNEALYKAETKDLEIQLKKEEQLRLKSAAQSKQITEKILKGSETISNKNIDTAEDGKLAALENQKNKELITEAEFEERKLQLQKDYAAKREDLANRMAGARAEAEREMEIVSLSAQEAALNKKLALAEKAGDGEAAAQLREEIDAVQSTLDEKGSFLTSGFETLQAGLGDVIGNLAGGDGEAVKKSFRGIFQGLAGALSQLASAKIIQMILESIPVGAGIFGFPAALALKPVLEGLVNGLMGSMLSGLLSFPTGAVFSKPTIAMVGDGARLGGENTEILLRNNQIQAIIEESATRQNTGVQNLLAALIGEVQVLQQERLFLKSGDVFRSSATGKNQNSRRIINLG